MIELIYIDRNRFDSSIYAIGQYLSEMEKANNWTLLSLLVDRYSNGPFLTPITYLATFRTNDTESSS